MKCPANKCKNPKVKTLETRTSSAEAKTYRVYGCFTCGFKFNTVETPVTDDYIPTSVRLGKA